MARPGARSSREGIEEWKSNRAEEKRTEELKEKTNQALKKETEQEDGKKELIYLHNKIAKLEERIKQLEETVRKPSKSEQDEG
jgi:hypothetical protein